MLKKLKPLLMATSLLLSGNAAANKIDLDDLKIPEYKEGIASCVVIKDSVIKVNTQCLNKEKLELFKKTSSDISNMCANNNGQWNGLNSKEFIDKLDGCNEVIFSSLYSTYEIYDRNIDFKNSGDQKTDFMNAFAQQSVKALCEKFEKPSGNVRSDFNRIKKEGKTCLAQMQEASAFTNNSPSTASTVLIKNIIDRVIMKVKL